MLRRLYERRHRARTGLALVEGWRALDGLFRAGARLHSVWVADDAKPPAGMADVGRRLAEVPLYTVRRSVLDTFADTAAPQGVVAVLQVVTASLPDVLAADAAPLILVLDGLQDPGNAGALVRTAVATGVTGIVTTSGTVDLYGPRALRGAAGLTPACPVVPDVDPDGLGRALAEAGLVISLLDINGSRSAFEVDWRAGRALIVGSEGTGASPALRRWVREGIRLPMRAPVESLNAAVSGAVCLYEAARRRERFAAGPGR